MFKLHKKTTIQNIKKNYNKILILISNIIFIIIINLENVIIKIMLLIKINKFNKFNKLKIDRWFSNKKEAFILFS